MKKDKDERKLEERALKIVNGYYDKLKNNFIEGIIWVSLFSAALLLGFGVI